MENEAELQANGSQTEQRIAEIRSKLDGVRGAESATLAALNKGSEDASKLAETEGAAGGLNDLQAQFARFEIFRDTLAAAQHASALVGAEKSKTEYEAMAREARQKHDQAQGSYEAAVGAESRVAAILEQEEQREDERQTARQKRDQLDALQLQLEELVQVQTAVSTAYAVVTLAKGKKDKAENKRQELEVRLQKAQEGELAAERLKGQLGMLQVDRQAAERAHGYRKKPGRTVKTAATCKISIGAVAAGSAGHRSRLG